jgi:hypothetical protein
MREHIKYDIDQLLGVAMTVLDARILLLSIHEKP